VELLVVIGIIAMLISILLPALSSVRFTARNVACAARMRDITHAVIMYANDNKDQLPPLHQQENPDPVNGWTSMSSGTDFQATGFGVNANNTSTWQANDPGVGLGRLYRRGYIKTTKVFICPSAEKVVDTDNSIGDDCLYYMINQHLCYRAWDGSTFPGSNLDVWWHRLSNYGRFAGSGKFRKLGTSTAVSQTYNNWRRAIVSEPLYIYNTASEARYETHRLGNKRAFNMGYPDGSVQTLVIQKMGSHVSDSYQRYLDLADAIQDALDGNSVDFNGIGAWINQSRYGVPIVPVGMN